MTWADDEKRRRRDSFMGELRRRLSQNDLELVSAKPGRMDDGRLVWSVCVQDQMDTWTCNAIFRRSARFYDPKVLEPLVHRVCVFVFGG
jgi:hypothetical protein